MTDEPGLYFEDLYVGQIFTSEKHVVDGDRMLAFAREFDPQDFHLGNAASILGETPASGWYTAALTQKLLTCGGLPLAKGMIGLSVEVSWPNATHAGDVIRVKTEVVELRASASQPGKGIAKIHSQTLNDSDTLLQLQAAAIMVDREPG